MNRLLTKALGVLALCLLCLPTFADKVGDPAKELTIAKWVQGKAVKLADGKGKQVYVVEFWATWCPPCRASIPHLSELNTKYKDKGVTFIGVSSEAAATVEAFVKKQGDKMNYTVAVDKDRKTSANYMTAFSQRGIPHAFIVDKAGKIAWHGHPMSPELETQLKGAIGSK